MEILLGILAGISLPVLTGINTRLTDTVGSPYNASLVSMIVSLIFLTGLLIFTGQGLSIPLSMLVQEPFWIWSGGICGVIFLTIGVLLFTRLGSVQAVILPVLGQILMGLLVDNFGLFYAEQSPLTFLRVIGAAFVIGGVIVLSLADKIKKGKPDAELQAIEEELELEKDQSIAANNSPNHTSTLFFWRIGGILAGMLSATQVAVNGYLGKILVSPIKASVISFAIGAALLTLICLAIHKPKASDTATVTTAGKQPWWIWSGGLLGGLYILSNIYLSGIIGTGMTVIILLIGAMSGGMLVDHLGMFGYMRNPVNIIKILGVGLMLAGAAAIKLY